MLNWFACTVGIFVLPNEVMSDKFTLKSVRLKAFICEGKKMTNSYSSCLINLFTSLLQALSNLQ